LLELPIACGINSTIEMLCSRYRLRRRDPGSYIVGIFTPCMRATCLAVLREVDVVVHPDGGAGKRSFLRPVREIMQATAYALSRTPLSTSVGE
jgi:hypothetical protein